MIIEIRPKTFFYSSTFLKIFDQHNNCPLLYRFVIYFNIRIA